MRRTTRSCRLGGIISARMKRWRSSGSTVGCAIGLPAFADAPVLCRKRSTWSTRPSHCLLPTTSIKQRQNSPCHCLLNTLEQAADIARNDASEQKLDKVRSLLAQGATGIEEEIPLIAALLSIPTDERYLPLRMSPQHQKE